MILQLSGEKETCLCLSWGLSSTPAPGPAHLTCLLLGLIYPDGLILHIGNQFQRSCDFNVRTEARRVAYTRLWL